MVVRGLADVLDLDPQLFSYSNLKNTEEGKHEAECMSLMFVCLGLPPLTYWLA